MRIGDVCPRTGKHRPKDTSALEAAKMMRDVGIVRVASWRRHAERRRRA